MLTLKAPPLQAAARGGVAFRMPKGENRGEDLSLFGSARPTLQVACPPLLFVPEHQDRQKVDRRSRATDWPRPLDGFTLGTRTYERCAATFRVSRVFRARGRSKRCLRELARQRSRRPGYRIKGLPPPEAHSSFRFRLVFRWVYHGVDIIDSRRRFRTVARAYPNSRASWNEYY